MECVKQEIETTTFSKSQYAKSIQLMYTDVQHGTYCRKEMNLPKT